MSFIAMNRFKVRLGSKPKFENVWKERQSRLNEVRALKSFACSKDPKATGTAYFPAM